MRVLYFQLTLILHCCFSLFGCLEDKSEIDDDIFSRSFARLRWLRVELGSVPRLALHRAAMPNIFLSFCFFLLVCFRRLNTLLPQLCLILGFTMSICIRVLLLYEFKTDLGKLRPANLCRNFHVQSNLGFRTSRSSNNSVMRR